MARAYSSTGASLLTWGSCLQLRRPPLLLGPCILTGKLAQCAVEWNVTINLAAPPFYIKYYWQYVHLLNQPTSSRPHTSRSVLYTCLSILKYKHLNSLIIRDHHTLLLAGVSVGSEVSEDEGQIMSHDHDVSTDVYEAIGGGTELGGFPTTVVNGASTGCRATALTTHFFVIAAVALLTMDAVVSNNLKGYNFSISI